jgi:ADP-ribosylglycohydrolase
MIDRTATADRKRGTLLSLSIADALGVAAEFKRRGTFPQATDNRGGGPHPSI